MQAALTIALLLIFNSFIQEFVNSPAVANILRWFGIPILFLHMVGALAGLIAILESISINIAELGQLHIPLSNTKCIENIDNS